jgi:hypothetical protein
MFVALAVATLSVDTLEVPVTLRDAPNRDVAFITAAFPLVYTFRVAMFASV